MIRFKTALAALAVAACAFWAQPITSPRAADVLTAPQQDAIRALIKDYLMANPEVIEEAMQELEKRRAREQDEARAKAVGEQSGLLFNSARQGEFGNPKGDVTIVEFFDYNCGFCKRGLGDVIALLQQDGNIRYVTKEFPVLGPGSVEAARISIAVARLAPAQHFEFHKRLLGGRGEANKARALDVAVELGLDRAKVEAAMEDAEVAATIEEVYGIANSLGLSGTPTYVIGQDVIPGAVGLERLKERVAEVRKCGPDGKKC
jgi:protein-disulfide isomerase